MGVEDMKKTEMRAAAEFESGSVRETGWCPLCFSAHLERCCLGQGKDLTLHCLGMIGAAGWMTEGSPLETKGDRNKKNSDINTYI